MKSKPDRRLIIVGVLALIGVILLVATVVLTCTAPLRLARSKRRVSEIGRLGN